MKHDKRSESIGLWPLFSPFLVPVFLLIAGCVSDPQAAGRFTPAEPVAVPALAYYQMLHRMSAAEIGRERMVLAALPSTPNNQLRMAMVLGHHRIQQDYSRALGLLDGILKSTDPAAQPLQGLARLLADHYAERQKLETQLDKQGAQLKESQRKAAELQEKIDSLADIERTLPPRVRSSRSLAPGGVR